MRDGGNTVVTDAQGRAAVRDREGTVATEPQLVRLQSFDPVVLKDVAARNGSAQPVEVTAHLFLPAGTAVNRPAVVIVHGLGGVKPVRELTYARKLSRAGCVVLVLDSFASRNLDGAPEAWRALRVGTWSLLADAFAGLRYLAGHPAVNPQAVSILGFSWGGMVAVLAAYEQVRSAYMDEEPLRFAAHMSYYGCSIPRMQDPTTTQAPVLVMLGTHDRNVAIDRAREICADLRRGGSQVEVHEFDAYHQWDGNDIETRHVGFSLAGMRLLIDRDCTIRSEDSDGAIEGMLSNAWMILRDVSLEGYDILRNEPVHRHSDRLLLDFLCGVARRQDACDLDPEQVRLGAIDGDIEGGATAGPAA